MTGYAWWFVGGIAALIVVLTIGSALTSRGYTFASGRVQGVIGLMGSGKSLFIVQRVILPAARGMSKKRGLHCSHTWRPVRRLITNFEINLPYDVPVVLLDGNRLWDHLVELATEFARDGKPALDAIVIIDEAHLFIPSGKQNVARKAAYINSMARKLNAEIWWISQSEMKVHKRLRDDSQTIWRVGRAGGLWTLITGPSKWFAARAYEPETMHRATATPIDRRHYRLSRQAIAAYDSFELIVPDAEADVSLDSLSNRSNVTPMPVRKSTNGPSTELPGSLDPFANDDHDASTG